MGDARSAALTVLERYRRTDGWSEALLDSVLKNEELSQRDAALCSRICYGVIQNCVLLDYYIEQYSSKPLKKIEPKVLDILRISSYQLTFMNKIPASAAVNSGVALTKSKGFVRAAGFVNAILRRIAEHVDHLPEPPGAGTASYLAIKYSHPLWLVEEIMQRLGYEGATKFLNANNGAVPTTIQVNTLKTSMQALKLELQENGLDCSDHPFLENCLLINHMGKLETLSAFSEGKFYVQDAAAKLAILAADPKAGMKVLDACAAPGGKSFAAGIQMGNQGTIISCDLHENKLSRIQAGAKRLGLDLISCHGMNAANPLPEYREAFDLVIADVPCSGMGIIRKKPEIRYKSLEELSRLPEIQFNILTAISECVRPGGVLLYSTCTIRRDENEAVVEEFLHTHDHYMLEAFMLPRELHSDGMLTLWPQIHQTDGFFIAKLRRQL
jgi:16S rRNA (cytosine967-C5)-methyltransferase